MSILTKRLKGRYGWEQTCSALQLEINASSLTLVDRVVEAWSWNTAVREEQDWVLWESATAFDIIPVSSVQRAKARPSFQHHQILSHQLE